MFDYDNNTHYPDDRTEPDYQDGSGSEDDEPGDGESFDPDPVEDEDD